MKVVLQKKFLKKLDKFSVKIQKQTQERLLLFQKDPQNSILNNHVLSGDLKFFRSINITGDLRAVFIYEPKNDLAIFYLLGTHSELYK